MRKVISKTGKFILLGIVALLLLLTVWSAFLYAKADMMQPDVRIDTLHYQPVVHDGWSSCNGSFLRQNSYGLWEQFLTGTATERGAASGALCRDLLYFQEKVFVDQIRHFVPSDTYLSFLRYLTVIFNRNLGKNIPLELREEIYAMSLWGSHEFDKIGTSYERQLNYHAAHDIGHTMQEYMLVGCTSFGVWGDNSRDGDLLIGRNFDFYVGEEFARNKVITFYVPAEGYKFASMGWAGMTGVLSGMNEKGLTVTLNAAKGPLPKSSATPVSILARLIVQYAANIEEAYQIASEYSTFVSESFLIGSSVDGKAAIIEKTPQKTALYTPEGNYVICSNHYQSSEYASDAYNVENIAESDSKYRYDRALELVQNNAPLTVQSGVDILRNRMGTGGKGIGLGNEMSINQFIGHHSVVFEPDKLLMWVSTAPWQSGSFICYDLNEIFAGNADFSADVCRKEKVIAADSLFLANEYSRLMECREMTGELTKATSGKNGEKFTDKVIADYIAGNPDYYLVYVTAGKYYLKNGDKLRAEGLFKEALEKEIPRVAERKQIETLYKKSLK